MLRILTIILFAFPLAATADPTLECSLNSGSQIEVGDCVARTDERVEKALGFALEQAMLSAKDLDQVTGRQVAVPALNQGQAAWETYRAAHCTYAGATYGGGSGAGIATRSCWVTLGRTRVEQLMRYADQ